MIHDIISTSIFLLSKQMYSEIEKQAIYFLKQYAGGFSILQDNVFSIIHNYDKYLEVLLYPIQDRELCGFVCNYKGKGFLYINTYLPLEKQIFTAGHELYHWFQQDSVQRQAHLTTDKNIEYDNTLEEKKANLFSALLLVPTDALERELKVLEVSNKRDLSLLIIAKLMNTFAVPYKAIIMRLFEIGLLNDKTTANEWMQIPDRDEQQGILQVIYKHDIGLKWQNPTHLIKYGNLKPLLLDNASEELITLTREKKDRQFLFASSIQLMGDIHG